MAVLPFFDRGRKLNSSWQRGGWRQSELAEFHRVCYLLKKNGLMIDVEVGLTDLDEPWAAFYDIATEETMIHLARLSGRYIFICDSVGLKVEATRLSGAFEEFEARLRRLWTIRAEATEKTGNVISHPSSRFLFILAAIYLVMKSQESAHADTGAVDPGSATLSSKLIGVISRFYDKLDSPHLLASALGAFYASSVFFEYHEQFEKSTFSQAPEELDNLIETAAVTNGESQPQLREKKTGTGELVSGSAIEGQDDFSTSKGMEMPVRKIAANPAQEKLVLSLPLSQDQTEGDEAALVDATAGSQELSPVMGRKQLPADSEGNIEIAMRVSKRSDDEILLKQTEQSFTNAPQQYEKSTDLQQVAAQILPVAPSSGIFSGAVLNGQIQRQDQLAVRDAMFTIQNMAENGHEVVLSFQISANGADLYGQRNPQSDEIQLEVTSDPIDVGPRQKFQFSNVSLDTVQHMAEALRIQVNNETRGDDGIYSKIKVLQSHSETMSGFIDIGSLIYIDDRIQGQYLDQLAIWESSYADGTSIVLIGDRDFIEEYIA